MTRDKFLPTFWAGMSIGQAVRAGFHEGDLFAVGWFLVTGALGLVVWHVWTTYRVVKR